MPSTTSPDIAFFISTLGDGGAQRTIVNLANSFSKIGYDVQIVPIKATGNYLDVLDDSVTLFELPSDRAITSLPHLIKYLNKFEPTILFSTMEYLNVIALLANILSRSPTKSAVRNANIQKANDKWSQAVQSFLASKLYKFADYPIAISNDVKQDMIDNYAISDSNLELIYNPVDTTMMRSLSEERPKYDKVNWNNNVILSVGRLSEQKDHRTLLKAVSLLKDEISFELVILGEGDRMPSLIALATELDIIDQVHFPGFVDNPYPFFKNADVLAHSSRWEGCPNVLIESLACGTPIVATDCPGGTSEILQNGEFGELVPIGDHEQLAAALKHQLENPPDPISLINRSLEFDIDKIVSMYEDLFFGH